MGTDDHGLIGQWTSPFQNPDDVLGSQIDPFDRGLHLGLPAFEFKTLGLQILVDFCFAFIVLIGMMFHYSIKPSGTIVLFPVLLLLAVGTALAAGLWLSALNVQFRDVKHTIPFLVQFWFFSTPVVYPSSIVPLKYRMWYGLNPMAGVVEGFRYCILR